MQALIKLMNALLRVEDSIYNGVRTTEVKILESNRVLVNTGYNVYKIDESRLLSFFSTVERLL